MLGKRDDRPSFGEFSVSPSGYPNMQQSLNVEQKNQTSVHLPAKPLTSNPNIVRVCSTYVHPGSSREQLGTGIFLIHHVGVRTPLIVFGYSGESRGNYACMTTRPGSATIARSVLGHLDPVVNRPSSAGGLAKSPKSTH
jgi:hypothetical protein